MATELLSYIDTLIEEEKERNRTWADSRKRLNALQQYADSQFKKAHNLTLFCAREPIDVRFIKHLNGEQAIYIDHKLVIIPEQSGMPHRHAYIELACILEGECDQIIEGERVHLCAGDTIIVDQNCRHMEAYTGKATCVIWLGLRREFLIDEVFPWLEGNGGLSSFIRSESQGNEKHLNSDPSSLRGWIMLCCFMEDKSSLKYSNCSRSKNTPFLFLCSLNW